MKYCQYCGNQMVDEAVICVKCGKEAKAVKLTDPGDKPSMGIAVLCFFVPVVGLILYLVWKDEKPLKAKSAGKGALNGFIVNIVVTVLLNVLMFVLGIMLESMAYDYWYDSYYYI